MLIVFLACVPSPEKGESPVPDSGPVPVPQWCPEVGEAPQGEGWSTPSHPSGGWATFVVPTTDPELLYVGATYGGAYRSQDGGKSWELLVNHSPPHAYGQLAVDPADPRRMVYPSGDLYLWENEEFQPLGIGSLQPGERLRGVVWTTTGLYAINQNGALFFAEDPSGTFEHIATLPPAPPTPPHAAMEVMGEDYWHLAASQGALLAAGESRALFRSVDGGRNWTQVQSGQIFGHSLVARGREVWVGMETVLLHSADDGESWEILGNLQGMPSVAAVREDGLLAIAEDSRLWLLDQGVLRGGTSVPAQVVGLGWMADGSLLLGHTNGLLRSTDEGQSWQDAGAEGYWDDNLSVVLAHPQCPGLVWAGTQCQRGWFRSTDWGQSWGNPADAYMHYVMEAQVDPHDGRVLWVTTDDHLLRSSDLGESWEESFAAKVHLHGLGVDPLVEGRILVGSVGSGDYADTSGKVYRSDDGGQSWADSSTGIPTWPGSVQSFAWSDTTKDLVFASTFKGGTYHDDGDGVGLYRSRDAGQRWERVLPDLDDVERVVACVGNFYALTEAHLYRSSDEGESWEVVMEQRASRLISVSCSSGRLALRSYNNVWISEDGKNWELLDGELPRVVQLGPADDVDMSAGMLYATQNGGGMYRYWVGD